MNTHSVRFQLGLWYAGLLSAVFVLLGITTMAVLRRHLEANVRDMQLRRAHQVAQVMAPDLQEGPIGRIAQEVEARFSPALNNRFLRIRSADGTVVYRSGAPQDHSFDPESIVADRWPEKAESSRKLQLPGGAAVVVASYVFRGSGNRLWHIEHGAPLEPVNAVLRHVAAAMAVTLLAAVAVAITGGYFLVGRALTVVDHISRSAEDISYQNLSDRLPIARTGDEIERLSVALNHMIERLDSAFQQSKRFVADASHELRTPLTILRGELEATLAQEGLASAVQERLGSLLEEVERLTKVVEGLLMLSRLDAGEAKSEWVSVDLAELTRSTAEQMSLLAEDRKIAMRRFTPAPVLVHGDRTRLKQVVVNLLDNSIKYTPQGGKVTLQVTTESGRAILEVADNGIGIPAEALPHVFERFFRADKARSQTVGGAGLGLAIVRSICIAHGGQVSVESEPGRGSRFRVELPLAEPSPASRTTGPALGREDRAFSCQQT